MKFLNVTLKLFFLCFLSLLCSCSPLLPKTTSQVVSETDSETVALMEATEDGAHIYCTAVWISDNQLLTANHCVDYAAEMALEAGDLNAFFTSVGVPISYSTKSEDMGYGMMPSGVHFGKVAVVDPEYDLALIQVEKAPTHRSAPVAKTPSDVGEKLYFVGHPSGLEWTHVEGLVASYREDLPVDFKGPFLQVSAPIWFGNSGGGAFDSHGRLVGIASFIMKTPMTGFYIPEQSINKFLEYAKERIELNK